MGREPPAYRRPLVYLLLDVHPRERGLHLYHHADAEHRPEHEVHEMDDVPDASHLLLHLQRLRCRLELLLLRQPPDDYPPDLHLPLGNRRQESA